MSQVNATTSAHESSLPFEEKELTLDDKIQEVAQQKIEPPPPPEEKERPWYKRTWRFVFRPVEKGIRYVKHHPWETTVAVVGVVLVILGSKSGEYPDDRPPGIIDDDMFAPFPRYEPQSPRYEPPPQHEPVGFYEPIRPYTYPPSQITSYDPVPVPNQQTLDKDDLFMGKTQQIKGENGIQMVPADTKPQVITYPETIPQTTPIALAENFEIKETIDTSEVFASNLIEASSAFFDSTADVGEFHSNKTEQKAEMTAPMDSTAIYNMMSPETTLPQETSIVLHEDFGKKDLDFSPRSAEESSFNITEPTSPKTELPITALPHQEEEYPPNHQEFNPKNSQNNIAEVSPSIHCLTQDWNIPDDPLPKAEVIFVNGIGNTKEDAQDSRDWSQKITDVSSIELIYNKQQNIGLTDGIIDGMVGVVGRDILTNKRKDIRIIDEITCAMGAKTKEAFQHGTFGLTDTSKKIILKALEFNNRSSSEDDRLISEVHSRGALDMKIALKFLNEHYPETAQKIIVVAIAPEDFIPAKMCAKVYHLVSQGDPIPALASETYYHCKKEGTVIELPQKGGPIETHSLKGGPYEKELKKIFSELRENHKIQ